MSTETLDRKTLRLYPDQFTEATCSYCGDVAARWNGAWGSTTSCQSCEDYAEAQYAAQGGE